MVLSFAIRSILAVSHYFPQLCVLHSCKHRMHQCIQNWSIVSVTNKPAFDGNRFVIRYWHLVQTWIHVREINAIIYLIITVS